MKTNENKQLKRLSKTFHHITLDNTSLLRCFKCSKLCISKSCFSRHKCDLSRSNMSMVLETSVQLFKCPDCTYVGNTVGALKCHKTKKHKKHQTDSRKSNKDPYHVTVPQSDQPEPSRGQKKKTASQTVCTSVNLSESTCQSRVMIPSNSGSVIQTRSSVSSMVNLAASQ